ncbi:ATP-binding protein [Salegentibacter sp. HM20]
MPYKLPDHIDENKEIARLRSLLSYNILDTAPEEEFDELAQILAIICDVPVAIISLIDEERQWYKAKIGVEQNEVPREESFCQHTVFQDEILEIPNALLDDRVKDSKHVTSPGGIRFYAGVAIQSPEGENIGTVCVADSQPKELNPQQRKALKLLSRQAMKLIEARKFNRELGDELQAVLQEKIQNTQRQLFQKQTEYNYLLEAIKKSNAVVEFSPEGEILEANERFAHCLGYKVEELKGKHHKTLVPEEDWPELELFWKKLKKGKFQFGKFRRKNRKGKDIWLQATYNPILDSGNKVVKVIKISEDITKELKAEKALRRAKESAEELNIQKDNFVANISHELRTPIHAVLGFADLLMHKEVDELKKGHLQAIRTAGDKLLFIINDLLDLSKMEAGVLQFEEAAFNLREVVSGVFSILRLKAEQKNLDFRFEIDPEIPEYLVGDKNRLAQVLINLLGNALKFTSEGKVELKVQAKPGSKSGSELNFKIIDTGIGIEKDKLEHIFDRFTQATEDTSRKYGGTGLGLNISRQLIEKQGGSLEVKSKPGKGSEFSFNLVFKKANQTGDDEVAESDLNSNLLEGNILLCEDNELNQRLMRALLEAKGFNLEIVSNGRLALQKVAEKDFDLIFMDLQMPEMGGLEATRLLRNKNINIPVVALTANFLMVEKQACFDAGMDDYLSKPFKKEELFSKIERHLQLQIKRGDTQKNLPENSVLKLENLEELSMGNKDFQKEMISLFLKQSAQTKAEMTQALAENNLSLLAAEAHKLKASFGILGADLTRLDKLEQASLAGELTSAKLYLEKLLEQLSEISYILNQKILPQLV